MVGHIYLDFVVEKDRAVVWAEIQVLVVTSDLNMTEKLVVLVVVVRHCCHYCCYCVLVVDLYLLIYLDAFVSQSFFLIDLANF